jgi:predicted esterase YcpF (UPF0227 family)
MKKIKLFEQYTETISAISNIDENQYDNTIEELDIIIEGLENSEELNEGLVGQVLGWVFFAEFMIIRQGYRWLKKKQKIKKMLANPKLTPEKKAKLKEQLKDLKYEEIKAKEEVEKKKQELDDKIKAKKAKMTPEEKEEYERAAAKKRAEVEKAQRKLDAEMDKFHGLEV